MQCRTHPERTGVNTCNQCGDWLCESCTVEINGRIFCRRCLAKLAEGEAPPPVTSRPAGAKRHISWGILLLFSTCMPPGVNYMYEGLIKRGLAALSGFFMLVYLTAQFSHIGPLGVIFGLSFPVLILTCIFDGFHIRRRINAGEVVNDDIDDVMRFVRRNKALIIGFIGMLLILSIAGAVLDTIPFVKSYLPTIAIVLGLYVLFKKPSRRHRHKRDDQDE